MRILMFLLGFLHVLRDIFIGLFVIIRDMILISKNNNEFLHFLDSDKAIPIIIKYLLLILIIYFMNLNIIFSLMIYGFGMIFFTSGKGVSDSENQLVISSLIGGVVLVVLLITFISSKTNEDIVGSITITENDIITASKGNGKLVVDLPSININLDIKKCKVGKYKVLHVTNEIDFKCLLNESYILNCSSNYTPVKHLDSYEIK